MKLPPMHELAAGSELTAVAVDWRGAEYQELRLVLPLPRTDARDAAVAQVVGRNVLLAGGATSQAAFDDALLRRGAAAQSQPAVDRVSISLTCPKHELVPLTREILQGLGKPRFSEDSTAAALRRETELARSLHGSRDVELHLRAAELRWGEAHPYALPFVDAGHVDAITRDELEAMVAERLTLRGATLLVVGDFSGASGRRDLEALAEILAQEDSRVAAAVPPSVRTTGGRHTFATAANDPLAALRWYLDAPLRQEDGHTALNVGLLIVAGYFGSRMIGELREKRGAVYGATAGFEVLHRAATAVVTVDCPADRYEEVHDEAHRLLDDLRRRGPSPEELAAAVRFGSRAARVGISSPSALATAGSTVLFGGDDLHMWQRQAHAMENLSTSDVCESLGRHMSDDRLLQLSLLPATE